MEQQDDGKDVTNSIVDIRKYLSTSDQAPIQPREFQEFWASCSEEEKEEFKRTPLK